MPPDKERDEGAESASEFSPEERERIRRMLVSHERTVWLWSLVGLWSRWMVYVSGGAAVIHTAWQELKEMLTK